MTTGNNWRIVLLAAGEPPRQAIRIYLCGNYYHATVTVRGLLGVKQVWYTRYVVPVSHSHQDDAWHHAEAIRDREHCPESMARLLQLEYTEAADCPADLFMVPRPKGMCWRCDRKLEPRERIFCAGCKADRARTYNSWINAQRRAKK